MLQWVHRIRQQIRHRYRPERYYMRGPGPASLMGRRDSGQRGPPLNSGAALSREADADSSEHARLIEGETERSAPRP